MNILISHLPQLIASAVVILLTPSSKYILRKAVQRYSILKSKSDTRALQIVHLISIFINFVCLFSLAVIWGVNPQNILLALSSIIAFVGVGLFAQWSILSNVTAGIVIFFSTPFHIGDKIQIYDKEMPITATIESIMTFYTHLRTEEGDLLVISNTLFLQKTISLLKAKDADSKFY